MKSVRLLVFTMLLASLAASGAHALDFKSVGAAPAVLYDAPSEKGRKVFIAPRGMPVEIVLTYGEWTKVRDASGDLFWIESKALTPKRNVIVSAASAKVRASADDAAPVLFSADKSVLFELAEPLASGWVKVRHRDGQSGYVKSTDVWGE
jgi:SH3-like domain-containing protein